MLIEIDASKSIQCAMCGEQHPATTDYFIRVNTTTIHDRCLACFDVFLGKERRVFDKYKPRPGYKWCRKCNTEYPATSAYWMTTKWGQLQAPCRHCIRANTTAWRDKNRGRLRESIQSDRSQQAELRTDRVKLIRSLPSDFTDEDWLFCLTYFNGRCAACKSPPPPNKSLHRDHWIALYSDECPGTVPTNIVPLCETCNSRKSTRPAGEWLAFEFGEEVANQRLEEINAFFALTRVLPSKIAP